MTDLQDCPFCSPNNKCNQKHCPYSKLLPDHNVVDLRGQKFGRLTPISYGHSEVLNRNSWKCRCECGKITYVHTKCLRIGSTKSCGCLRKEILERYNKKRPSQTALNAFYYSYKKRSNLKELDFELSIKDFENITSKSCFYCGYKGKVKKVTNSGSKYSGNGIDRKDNSKGYTLTNSVPSCGICNRMKMDMSYKEFITHINKILVNIETNEKEEEVGSTKEEDTSSKRAGSKEDNKESEAREQTTKRTQQKASERDKDSPDSI